MPTERLIEQRISGVFDHPDNITLGKGRVIWAPSCGPFIPEGWVLPGGLRTTDIAGASAMAQLIDQLSRR